MSLSSKSQLPRILCLHGAGSSGDIFRIQGRKIFHALRQEFQFVFVNAPFLATAGPGMYPAYEDSGPFFRWQCDLTAASSFDITEDEVRAEIKTMYDLLDTQLRSGGAPPFVGVMAFSQGARVATALLLHLQEKRRSGCHHHDLPDLKFIVLNSATYPPLFFDLPAAAGGEGGSPCERQRILGIPSIHIQGSKDPWQPESEKLREVYFDENSLVIPFSGGHQVPVMEPTVDRITAAIRKLAAQT